MGQMRCRLAISCSFLLPDRISIAQHRKVCELEAIVAQGVTFPLVHM